MRERKKRLKEGERNGKKINIGKLKRNKGMREKRGEGKKRRKEAGRQIKG